MEHSKTTVQMRCDITGRLAHRLSYKMQPIQSSVFIFHCGRNVNAKSLLGILSLGLKDKDIVDITCYNENDQQAELDIKAVERILTTLDQENN